MAAATPILQCHSLKWKQTITTTYPRTTCFRSSTAKFPGNLSYNNCDNDKRRATIQSVNPIKVSRGRRQSLPFVCMFSTERESTDPAEGEREIRFGIVGCADIARKVSRAITLAPNATIVAVASRSAEKAAEFAKESNFPSDCKIFGNYETLLDDPDIDAVYMPLPTSLHLKWAVLAAQKKKHVLLEKPVALHTGEFDRIMEAFEVNGLQLMDGTMWMHNPRTEKIREFLKDTERFGQLKLVHTCFTFAVTPDFLENDIRVKPDLDALGALGDAGWYAVRGILFATDYELPNTVIAFQNPVFNKAGVILSCGASLNWEDGKVATFYCSFLSNLTMNLTAIGTSGTVQLNDFVVPFQEHEASFTANMKSGFNELVTGWAPIPSEQVVTTELPQEACMVREFSRLVASVKSGAKPEKKWPIRSRKTLLILDAVRASIEKGYEPVEIVG